MSTPGEQWTREQLDLLRAQDLHPAAFGRFLAASLGRAAMVRRSRPELARREAHWAGAGAAAWLALAALGAQPFRRRVRAGLGGWALTIAMLDWHLGMLETPDGRPRNLGPADAATLMRAWLVPAVADEPRPWLCAVAYASDVADGVLARATQPTRLGRDLEGLVDSAFAAAALRGALRRGWVARQSALIELARLAAGLGYALTVYFGAAQTPDPLVLRAARMTTPLRAAGLIAAGSGRRREAGALLLAGSGTSTVAIVVALGRRRPIPGLGTCVMPWRTTRATSTGASATPEVQDPPSMVERVRRRRPWTTLKT